MLTDISAELWSPNLEESMSVYLKSNRHLRKWITVFSHPRAENCLESTLVDAPEPLRRQRITNVLDTCAIPPGGAAAGAIETQGW